MEKVTLKQAIELAAAQNLALTKADIKLMLEKGPDEFKRPAFSDQKHYDFYQTICGRPPVLDVNVIWPELNPSLPIDLSQAIIAEVKPVEESFYKVDFVNSLSDRYIVTKTGLAQKKGIELSEQLLTTDMVTLLKADEIIFGLQSATTWMLGDIIRMLMEITKDEFDISEFVDPQDRKRNTIDIAYKVARAFPIELRDPDLQFTHYREVYYTKGIPPEQKEKLLQVAKKMQLSCRDTRKLASYVKHCEDKEAVVDAMVESPDVVVTALHVERTFNYFNINGNTLERLELGDQSNTAQFRTTNTLEYKDADGTWRPIMATNPHIHTVAATPVQNDEREIDVSGTGTTVGTTDDLPS